MANSALIFRSGSPIGEIVLNQPQKRNAISAAMWGALKEAVAAAEADAAVKAIVIRGEGDHFAAGADISEFAKVYETAESAKAYTLSMLDALKALEGCAKPTLTQIRGACVGGGCSIALACDFRFAGASARFGVTPGKLGLVYSLADTRRLTAVAGEGGAKDLLLTGRLVGAEEALSMGLCDRLYPDDALAGEVAAFAGQIAALSQWSVRATKETLRLLKNGAVDDDPQAMQLMLAAFEGEDFKEGYQAFLEKRAPKFKAE